MRFTSITPVSQPYLSQLRAGTRTRPSEAAVEALADFFGIDPLYFSDDRYYREIDEELEWLNIFRDRNVREVAMRVVGLSPDAQDELVQLADELRRKEGLDDVGPPISMPVPVSAVQPGSRSKYDWRRSRRTARRLRG